MKKQLFALALSATLTSFTLMGYAQQSTPSPSTMAPLNADGVVMVDLPASSAEAIRLDIKQGRIADHSVGRLILDAQGIDFKQGSLKSLGAEVQDGNFDNVLVDKLRLDTSAFSFDTFELLNHRRFVLDHAVDAAVSLRISEENLNRFFSNPKTIERLEKAVAKKTGNMSLITFSNPSIKLLDRSRVKLTLNSSVGNAIGAPMEMVGNLGLKEGKLNFNNFAMTSNGVQLPFEISGVVEKKMNEMMDLEKLGKNNFVIKAQDLHIANRAIEVKGRAALTRLEFGK